MAMVRSVNKVMLTGRVGSIYERKDLRDGKPGPLNISIATQEIFRGNKQRTDWHKVTFWGVNADFAEKYLAVGALVAIEGSLRTVQKRNPDGSVSAYVNIEGHQLTLLVGAQKNAQSQEGERGPAADEDQGPDDEPPDDQPKDTTGPDDDDDIPF